MDVDTDGGDECPKFGSGSGADEGATAAETHFDGLSLAWNSSRDEGASQQWKDL